MLHDDMLIRNASLTTDRGWGALLTDRFGKRLWQLLSAADDHGG